VRQPFRSLPHDCPRWRRQCLEPLAPAIIKGFLGWAAGCVLRIRSDRTGLRLIGLLLASRAWNLRSTGMRHSASSLKTVRGLEFSLEASVLAAAYGGRRPPGTARLHERIRNTHTHAWHDACAHTRAATRMDLHACADAGARTHIHTLVFLTQRKAFKINVRNLHAHAQAYELHISTRARANATAASVSESTAGVLLLSVQPRSGFATAFLGTMFSAGRLGHLVLSVLQPCLLSEKREAGLQVFSDKKTKARLRGPRAHIESDQA
jgi:hypothetical protein